MQRKRAEEERQNEEHKRAQREKAMEYQRNKSERGKEAMERTAEEMRRCRLERLGRQYNACLLLPAPRLPGCPPHLTAYPPPHTCHVISIIHMFRYYAPTEGK